MRRYVLPDLPYDYGALEPHLNARLMQLHHDKHHRAYVEAANQAIDKLMQARRDESFEQIASLERQLAFNISGHVLHSLFWQNLTPQGGGEPQGELARAIRRDFGSFALFKQQLVQTASTIMGSGWAALVWEPVIKRLGTTQIHDHQSEITQAGIPLLVLDAWEHAYYLQYPADKASYFEAIWNLWNWDDVAARYDKAQSVELGLTNVVESVDQPTGASRT